jgi:hypothetical protein
MEIEHVINWLQEGDEWEAAALLAQCDLEVIYADEGYPFDDSPPIPILEVHIQAPRRTLERIDGDLRILRESIKKAVQQVSSAERSYTRDVYWVPRLASPSTSPSDTDVGKALEALGSAHLNAAWSKALSRRNLDPDGAITAAKALLESVCKHILTRSEKTWPGDADINKLYYLAAHSLDLSPRKDVDGHLKKILGNCQAVVTGVAFLRNQLGDAHGKEEDWTAPDAELSALAVNLAGTMAMFLASVWERKQT